MQKRLFAAFRCALSAALLAGLVSAKADAALLKLPPREAVPVGLEMQATGTALEMAHGILNADVLIRDHAGEAHLSAGASQMVLKFPRQEILRTLTFINDGMEGEIRLSASHDNRHWTALAADRFTVSDRQVSVSPGCAQGKFLKVEFDSRRGGTIRCLRIQGDQTDLNYRVHQQDGGAAVPVNFASGLGGGRMVYASQGSDGASGSGLTVVYDLGQPRRITEFASVHSRLPVALRVFALQAMPETEDWRGRPKFDPGPLAQAGNLVAEAADTFGSGHVRIQLERPVVTRYLAMTWQGDSSLAGFKAYEVAASGLGVVAPTGQSADAESVPLLAGTEASGRQASEEPAASKAEQAGATDPDPRRVAVVGVEAASAEQAPTPPSAAPVMQAFYQPSQTRAFFAGALGGYSSAMTGAPGTVRDKNGAVGTRRARKANEEPVTEEEEEFEGPAFGIEWCLSPSAT